MFFELARPFHAVTIDFNVYTVSKSVCKLFDRICYSSYRIFKYSVCFAGWISGLLMPSWLPSLNLSQALFSDYLALVLFQTTSISNEMRFRWFHILQPRDWFPVTKSCGYASTEEEENALCWGSYSPLSEPCFYGICLSGTYLVISFRSKHKSWRDICYLALYGLLFYLKATCFDCRISIPVSEEDFIKVTLLNSSKLPENINLSVGKYKCDTSKRAVAFAYWEINTTLCCWPERGEKRLKSKLDFWGVFSSFIHWKRFWTYLLLIVPPISWKYA